MIEEFSRPIPVADISAAGRVVRFDATAAECARLAARFAIPAVLALRIEGRLAARANGREYHLQARVTAAVRQTCVVTLAPVEQTVSVALERLYSTALDDEFADAPRLGADIELTGDSDDRCEPLLGDVIDVGAAAAEEIALNLDPYPRRDIADAITGAASGADAVAADGRADSPFSVLAGRVASDRHRR